MPNDALENRVEALESGFTRVQVELDGFRAEVQESARAQGSRLDRVDARLDRVEARLDRIESRLDAVEFRLDRVEARLASLESKVDENGRHMRVLHEDLIARIGALGDMLPKRKRR